MQQREDGRAGERCKNEDMTTTEVANFHRPLPRLPVSRWRAQLRPAAGDSTPLVESDIRAEGNGDDGGMWLCMQPLMKRSEEGLSPSEVKKHNGHQLIHEPSQD